MGLLVQPDYWDVQPTPRTQHQVIPQAVPAAPPNEAGWSFAALLNAFTASLTSWMCRLGVPPGDVEDATQEALVEAWQRASTLPIAQDEARREMFRIAATIAQRSKRRAARVVYVDELEVGDPRDAEGWIGTRMLWVEALYRLDEPTRALILARHVDGRTCKDIGVEIGQKEETIRQRAKVAEKKLQVELDKLLGNDKRRENRSVAMGIGFALDSFDRAVFGAITDVEEEFGVASSPASTVRPRMTARAWPWQCVPAGFLAITLFFVPGQGWRSEALRAEKIGSIRLPAINVRAAMPTEAVREAATPDRFTRKTTAPRPPPVLRAEDVAVVKRLRQRSPLNGAL